MLVMAPFIIDTIAGKGIAAIGLLLLTVQAFQLRAWNLIALNLIGTLGYFWSIYNAI